ncbi:GspE/PulE family protein, partial [Candidatus Hydrogenedentota bacterium]
RKRLGQLLLDTGGISEKSLKTALNRQKSERTHLGEILVSMGACSDHEMADALGIQLGIPVLHIASMPLEPDVVHIVPQELAEKHCILPVEIDGEGHIILAMANPVNLVAIDDVRKVTGREVRPALATDRDIRENIKKYFHIDQAINQLIEGRELANVEVVTDSSEPETDDGWEQGRAKTPTIRLVYSILVDAVQKDASDVHLEPRERDLLVRYRIDGYLFDQLVIPKHAQAMVVSRIKILSELDISEHRKPQDGRAKLRMPGSRVDLRISILPVMYGEKVVIRILDTTKGIISLESIGFSPDALDSFRKLLRHPQGILLVTGPVGSGKTTTLYAALSDVVDSTKNVVTVEDPIEYALPGVNQVAVNEKAGITFANTLRSILRQDPNIIMVGEIRDFETADIAFRAALTGHLVLSTLHTNDAPSTLMRLLDLGVEHYLIASCIRGVMAQRLPRLLCTSCKVDCAPEEIDSVLMAQAPPDVVCAVTRPVGCRSCNGSGYRGRVAITEILTVDRYIRDAIIRRASLDELIDIARNHGFKTLQEDGVRKVCQGLTSVEEIMRLTYGYG